MPHSISHSMVVEWVAGGTLYTTPDDPASRVLDLERRILAPCCRRQTLEDHGSEAARTLRAEIRWRVMSGEASCVIEQDLMLRYGDDIRVNSHSPDRGARDPR